MWVRVLLCIFFSYALCLSSSVLAEDGYIGEDLGNDIYKRLDEGVYKLKTQLVENRLKGSGDRLNTWIGKICSKKTSVPQTSVQLLLCLRPSSDFTVSELEAISGGDMGPIYTHMDGDADKVDTDLIIQIRGVILEHYDDIKRQVTGEQKKLQSIGSIGLFTDGNKDNSSYDLMVDLQNIHTILFTKDIPYNGTANLGGFSVANLLENTYEHPMSPISGGSGSIGSGGVSQGVPYDSKLPQTNLTLSGLLNGEGVCAPTEMLPTNLDPNFFRDVQSQLYIGTNPDSTLAFADNGKLPEHWAKVAQGKGMGGSMGISGGGSDTFPCSGKDFFCLTVGMTSYAQNLLGGGKTSTIEKILDENLKIANKFAPSSFVQSKMTKMFFGLSLKGLDLPSMIHIGVNVSRLPPPILNLKSGKKDIGEDEINKILIGTFGDLGLDFKRQNSLEQDNVSRTLNNLPYLTTDSFLPKSVSDVAPIKSGYIQAKEMELKKRYNDSFNDDLFELHDFTLAFSKSIETITSIIVEMHKIPKK